MHHRFHSHPPPCSFRPVWNEPYLETCCRAALHRLVLTEAVGRPPGLKDGPCLERLAGMGLAARTLRWPLCPDPLRGRPAHDRDHARATTLNGGTAHPRARRLSWLCGTLGRFLSRHHPLSFLPAGPQHTRSSPRSRHEPRVHPGRDGPSSRALVLPHQRVRHHLDNRPLPHADGLHRLSHLPPLPRLLGPHSPSRSCSAWCGRCRAPPSPPGKSRRTLPCCRTSSAFLPSTGVYWSLTVELRFYAYALAIFMLGQWRRVQTRGSGVVACGTGSRRAQRHGRLGPLAPAAIADDPIRPVSSRRA